MFDAKSVLGALLGGAQQQQGGLGAVLGGLLNQAQGGAQGAGGGLGDILGKLAGGAGAAGAAGGIGGALGGLLNQATGGLRDAANHAGQAAGRPNAVNDILAQLGGGQGGDLVGKLRQMIENNPGMATAGLGGLASVVLGTGAGRNLAATAAKIGGLALIGGLAYSAWQNAQAGRNPPAPSEPQQIAAAPAGSGFEPEAATNESATLMIRAMIAAAAADGEIDTAERALILGSLQQAGFDAEANDWLQNEMANPASIEDLAGEVGDSQELASQVYTAARLAIHPDKRAEQKFLLNLSSALGLPDEVVAHIDATTDAAQAAA